MTKVPDFNLGKENWEWPFRCLCV
uniref:Uncharacterized protein n=1 Tax=Rhizophora mucronata TaxID=61149 RepID=A0A2P2NJW7_RHIMU